MSSEPSELHRAFAAHGELDWGPSLASVAAMARMHGRPAVEKSMRLLAEVTAIEPRVTADFLDSLPASAAPYQLSRRIKSPESLARKIQLWEELDRRFPIDDVLRYTALTRTSEELVRAARQTVDELNRRGWQVTYAMHSYTEGSRYKGIHAYLAPPRGPRVEVQFHSTASVKVKEATTRWYEIDRSDTATLVERTAARQQCVDLSATLQPPTGIDGLTRLGGRKVAVNNYSDSRQPPRYQAGPVPDHELPVAQSRTLDRNDGITR
ncbi:hypothetical protein [Kribbella sp. NPDC049227]|uniref:hypothetical protein n=1 Tax=Kribbella sp. NPDC049227 TaxID=3364113 RepID=UPI00371472F0